jgi:ABC-type sugar transport system permease subunit
MKTDDNGNLLIDLPKHTYLRVKMLETYPGFNVIRSKTSLNFLQFYISEDSIKMIGSGGRLVEPATAKTFKPLDGLERFASKRGYIWGRSIPLISEHFIIGAGADNYPIAFPQDDFVAKMNIGMTATTVIDKPHNMYLQIATNTGLVSLIAVLVVLGIYIINSIMLYWKLKLDSTYKYIGLACFISIIGYLFAGIFNDHIVSVAPMFWCIFGLGISINAKLKIKEAINV